MQRLLHVKFGIAHMAIIFTRMKSRTGKRLELATRFSMLVAAFVIASCAAAPQSPRTAYEHPPTQESSEEPQAFHVVDRFSWKDAVLAGSGLPKGERDIGLFAAADFRLVTGECTDCEVPGAALWYFRNEIIAVPHAALATRATRAPASLRKDSRPPFPLLVWIAAPDLIHHARLSGDAQSLEVDGKSTPLRLMARLPTNSAYVDASTAAFFGQHSLRVRGALARQDGHEVFIARTFWPEDARIDVAALKLQPLKKNEFLGTLVQAQTDGAEGLFSTRLLWERDPGTTREWAGRPVAAFVLSGAESEDDLALGGHVTVATGTFGQHGEWSDWLVNNFYPLDTYSEKGIISAAVPMDNYLFDFNSGQSYYRPSYMLVAVLKRPEAANAMQAALQEEMAHYYCGRIKFNLATQNSTALTVDPLRALGWRIPTVGPTSYAVALAGMPIAAAIQKSVKAGVETFDFLTEEQTRVMPRQAFEVMGQDLLYLASARRANQPLSLTPFERMLADDVEALIFVRIPQVPSQRELGTYPVRSLIEYGAQVYTEHGPMKRAMKAGERHLPDDLKRACND